LQEAACTFPRLACGVMIAAIHFCMHART
jgi:hypothetical protein